MNGQCQQCRDDKDCTGGETCNKGRCERAGATSLQRRLAVSGRTSRASTALASRARATTSAAKAASATAAAASARRSRRRREPRDRRQGLQRSSRSTSTSTSRRCRPRRPPPSSATPTASRRRRLARVHADRSHRSARHRGVQPGALRQARAVGQGSAGAASGVDGGRCKIVRARASSTPPAPMRAAGRKIAAWTSQW